MSVDNEPYFIHRWTALSSTLQAPPAHRWMTSEPLQSSSPSKSLMPPIVLLAPSQIEWVYTFLTTLAGGCARLPLTRGKPFRVGDVVGVCRRAPVPAVQVCAGQAAERGELVP